MGKTGLHLKYSQNDIEGLLTSLELLEKEYRHFCELVPYSSTRKLKLNTDVFKNELHGIGLLSETSLNFILNEALAKQVGRLIFIKMLHVIASCYREEVKLTKLDSNKTYASVTFEGFELSGDFWREVEELYSIYFLSRKRNDSNPRKFKYICYSLAMLFKSLFDRPLHDLNSDIMGFIFPNSGKSIEKLVERQTSSIMDKRRKRK